MDVFFGLTDVTMSVSNDGLELEDTTKLVDLACESGNSDTLFYFNGRTSVRRFQTWSEGRGYTLLIGEKGGAQSYVESQIEAKKRIHVD